MLLSPLLQYRMLLLGLLVGSSWLIVVAADLLPVHHFLGSGVLYAGSQKVLCKEIFKTQFNLLESYSDVDEYETLRDFPHRIIRISEDGPVVGIRWGTSVLVKNGKAFYGVIKDELSPNAVKLIKSSESFDFTLEGKCDMKYLAQLIKDLHGCDVCISNSPLFRAVDEFLNKRMVGLDMASPVLWDAVLFEDKERAVHLQGRAQMLMPTVLLRQRPPDVAWKNYFREAGETIDLKDGYAGQWRDVEWPVMLLYDDMSVAFIKKFGSRPTEVARYDLILFDKLDQRYFTEEGFEHLKGFMGFMANLIQQEHSKWIKGTTDELRIEMDDDTDAYLKLFFYALLLGYQKGRVRIRETDADEAINDRPFGNEIWQNMLNSTLEMKIEFYPYDWSSPSIRLSLLDSSDWAKFAKDLNFGTVRQEMWIADKTDSTVEWAKVENKERKAIIKLNSNETGINHYEVTIHSDTTDDDEATMLCMAGVMATIRDSVGSPADKKVTLLIDCNDDDIGEFLSAAVLGDQGDLVITDICMMKARLPARRLKPISKQLLDKGRMKTESCPGETVAIPSPAEVAARRASAAAAVAQLPKAEELARMPLMASDPITIEGSSPSEGEVMVSNGA
eukprot:GHVS01061370.1.p1 GENE.GHVS01061370.1~~GHVS01061370.1.p1  ORF type:complete len:617 (+),score=57.24 GHVS01061370.1:201-2051(+)